MPLNNLPPDQRTCSCCAHLNTDKCGVCTKDALESEPVFVDGPLWVESESSLFSRAAQYIAEVERALDSAKAEVTKLTRGA
jgi:hypothetical protein